MNTDKEIFIKGKTAEVIRKLAKQKDKMLSNIKSSSNYDYSNMKPINN